MEFSKVSESLINLTARFTASLLLTQIDPGWTGVIAGETHRRTLIRSWARTIFAGIGNNRSKGGPCRAPVEPPVESLLSPLLSNSFSARSPGAARFRIRPGQWFMTENIEEIERGKGDLPVAS